jgi:hypothetical protein
MISGWLLNGNETATNYHQEQLWERLAEISTINVSAFLFGNVDFFASWAEDLEVVSKMGLLSLLWS